MPVVGMPVHRSLIKFWMTWATFAALSLRLGWKDLFDSMVSLALAVALATLEALGIHYGARTA